MTPFKSFLFTLMVWIVLAAVVFDAWALLHGIGTLPVSIIWTIIVVAFASSWRLIHTKLH